MSRPTLYASAIPFFLTFRLISIPASILSNTGHGLPWLTAALGLTATFGAEWLTRRLGGDPGLRERQRGLIVVLLALITLGFFPEEAPIGVILWAGSGAAWGAATRGQKVELTPAITTVGALTIGALLGASAFFGPGSWLAAVILGAGAWLSHGRGGEKDG